MAVITRASLPISTTILLVTVVPGTILATVGSFLNWYHNEEFDVSRKGTDVYGVGVATLAIASLLATAALIALRGRAPWLLGMVFVLALVAAADAGNWVAIVEQSDDLSTREGLYLAVIGSGLAAVGSATSFLFSQMAGPVEGMTGGAEISEDEAPTSSEPEEPNKS